MYCVKDWILKEQQIELVEFPLARPRVNQKKSKQNTKSIPEAGMENE